MNLGVRGQAYGECLTGSVRELQGACMVAQDLITKFWISQSKKNGIGPAPQAVIHSASWKSVELLPRSRGRQWHGPQCCCAIWVAITAVWSCLSGSYA